MVMFTCSTFQREHPFETNFGNLRIEEDIGHILRDKRAITSLSLT